MKTSIGMIFLSIFLYALAHDTNSLLLLILALTTFIAGCASVLHLAWKMFLAMPPMQLNRYNALNLCNFNEEIESKYFSYGSYIRL